MTIQTDLSVSPYFDDYSDAKDFYKILFRPGVAVQARELNQLQTILQKQVERFGNHVFRQGTIIDGCDITFHSTALKYVKIRDVETNATNVVPSTYVGYRVKNQNNPIPLEATIITTTAGFEATSPNLNTLYIRYLNTGLNGAVSQPQFVAGEPLIVYNPDSPIEKITVNAGSIGFGPTDRVIILSAITVGDVTGPVFAVGNFIAGGTANVEIVAIDTTTTPGSTILKIKPRAVDLATGDASKWTFAVDDNILKIGGSPPTAAKVTSIVGSGAAAVLATTESGIANTITISQKGSGYIVTPTVSISSLGASEAQIGAFTATPQTELAFITAAPGTFEGPVGSAYGMTVGEGVIYQKGYSRASPSRSLLLTNIPIFLMIYLSASKLTKKLLTPMRILLF